MVEEKHKVTIPKSILFYIHSFIQTLQFRLRSEEDFNFLLKRTMTGFLEERARERERGRVQHFKWGKDSEIKILIEDISSLSLLQIF